MTPCGQISNTKCEKYTLWDAFLTSNLILCLFSQSLQEHRSHLSQDGGCVLAWGQMPLRLRQDQGLLSLPTTQWHIGLYIYGPES